MAILSFLFHSQQWRESLETSRPALYRVAYAWCRDAALADDLVQEATTKALERGDQLRDPTRFKGWLFAILSRCWHDHLRARHPHEDIDELSDEYLAGGSTPPEEAERRQTVSRVRAAVARLPVGQRQVLTLVDLEEFGYAEVGEVLQIPIGTVMSRLHRARRALREDLLRIEATATLRESEMMHDISDEQLNAFIDDELDSADRERVLAAMAVNGELAQRACALRLIKEQVRHAYAEPPAAPSRRQPARPWRALAMALLLAVAALGGWIARDQAGMGGDTVARKPGTGHVILHLATWDEQRARIALDDAEGLLRTAHETAQPIAVELVADAGGLDLLRAGVSPHADRIARLRAEHPNLALIACGQTVERLRERGIEVRLLPGTRIASSALDQIVTRMGQGWSYVRI